MTCDRMKLAEKTTKGGIPNTKNAHSEWGWQVKAPGNYMILFHVRHRESCELLHPPPLSNQATEQIAKNGSVVQPA